MNAGDAPEIGVADGSKAGPLPPAALREGQHADPATAPASPEPADRTSPEQEPSARPTEKPPPAPKLTPAGDALAKHPAPPMSEPAAAQNGSEGLAAGTHAAAANGSSEGAPLAEAVEPPVAVKLEAAPPFAEAPRLEASEPEVPALKAAPGPPEQTKVEAAPQTELEALPQLEEAPKLDAAPVPEPLVLEAAPRPPEQPKAEAAPRPEAPAPPPLAPVFEAAEAGVARATSPVAAAAAAQAEQEGGSEAAPPPLSPVAARAPLPVSPPPPAETVAAEAPESSAPLPLSPEAARPLSPTAPPAPAPLSAAVSEEGAALPPPPPTTAAQQSGRTSPGAAAGVPSLESDVPAPAAAAPLPGWRVATPEGPPPLQADVAPAGAAAPAAGPSSPPGLRPSTAPTGRPLAVALAPRPKSAQAAGAAPAVGGAPPVSRERELQERQGGMVQALVEHLQKQPTKSARLNMVGVYLRTRGLVPRDPPSGWLKTTILSAPDLLALYMDAGPGTESVSLRQDGGAFPAPVPALAPALAAPPLAAAPSKVAPFDSLDPDTLQASACRDSALPVKFWLLEALVNFMLQRPPGEPASMPALGQFCIKELGIQTKGNLRRYLLSRPRVFRISDDPRQHVTLTEAAAAGSGVAHAARATAALPPLPDLDDIATLSGAAVAFGPPYQHAQHAPQQQQAGAATAANQAAVVALQDVAAYRKWDPLTQAAYHFVHSRGVATFAQLDQHLKATAAKHIAGKRVADTRVPLATWHSKIFLKRRQNVFRISGQVVSLLNHPAGAPPLDDLLAAPASHAPAGAPPLASHASYPPLQHAPQAQQHASYPPPQHAPQSQQHASYPPPQHAPQSQQHASYPPPQHAPQPQHASEARQPPAAPPEDNPLIRAMAAERAALEALRDDVAARLAQFKALGELQRENAGLRASCVTLGRELLTLKNEVAQLQQQQAMLASAVGLAAVPAAATGAASPAAQALLPPAAPAVAAPGPSAGAAAAAAAPAVAAGPSAHAAYMPPHVQRQQEQRQQEQQQQKQQAGPSSPAAVPAPAKVVPAPAAAPAGPDLLTETIVLVGGHDGASWLNTVEVYNTGSASWASLPPLDLPRSFSAAAASPAHLFVAGGGDGQEWFDSAVAVDRANLAGGWRALAPMSAPRGSLAAAVVGAHLYALGGGRPSVQLDLVEWYDAARDQWLPGPPMRSPRFALGACAVDGAIYASYLTSVERLDPREGAWRLLAAGPGMASRRGGHAVAAAAGLVYALGGFDSQHAIADCETGVWRQIAPMSDARAYGGAAGFGGGGVYAVGGMGHDLKSHSLLVETYSPASNSWQHLPVPAHVNPRRSFLAACGVA
eukprot:scaffold5.g817.t1